MKKKMNFNDVKKFWMYEDYQGIDTGDSRKNSSATTKGHKHSHNPTHKSVAKTNMTPAQWRRVHKGAK